MERSPAAEGSPSTRNGDGCVSDARGARGGRRRGAALSSGALGSGAQRGRRGLSVSEPRPAASGHARRAADRAPAEGRGDRQRDSGHRIPPPRRREDG